MTEQLSYKGKDITIDVLERAARRSPSMTHDPRRMPEHALDTPSGVRRDCDRTTCKSRGSGSR